MTEQSNPGLETLIDFGAVRPSAPSSAACDAIINCACLGNVIKLPLSTVSLVEDVGMGAMALAMLLSR